MLGGVFISYRREDFGGFAGRIYDRLAERLGHESVFFDVDNIPPGLDFVDVLSERVGRCDALVAIIGRHWLTSADTDNRRRLDDPSDFVRIEIEAALGRGVRVIPVLVDGAGMPRAEDLPESLKKLARRQGVEISHTRFDSDVERLTKVLSSIEEEARRADPVDARTAARERESPPAGAVPGEDLASKKEAPLDRNDSGASPAPGATGKRLTPLVLAAAAAAVLLALGALFVLRSRPPEPTSPSADLARPSSPATLDPDASPSAPALTPPGSTANAAKSAIEVLGPPSKLLGGAPNAAAEAPTSKEDLARELEQQKGALANATQDIDRLTREANAAVQGIRTDDAPANTKYANAAAPAPNGSARYRTTDCGSIADTKTGVEWYVGPDRDFAWQDANNWVRGLSACGKHWTLPSADEARALFDKQTTAGTGYYSGGRTWPAHVDPIFSGIGGGSWVWTKGSSANGNAPAFNLNQGVPVQISATNFDGTVRAFAVAR